MYSSVYTQVEGQEHLLCLSRHTISFIKSCAESRNITTFLRRQWQRYHFQVITDQNLDSYHIDTGIDIIAKLTSLSIFPTISAMVVKLSHLLYWYWLGCQCISVLPTISPDQSPPHLTDVGDWGKERDIVNIRSILRMLRYWNWSSSNWYKELTSVLPTIPPNQSPSHLAEVCDGMEAKIGS